MVSSALYTQRNFSGNKLSRNDPWKYGLFNLLPFTPHRPHKAGVSLTPVYS